MASNPIAEAEKWKLKRCLGFPCRLFEELDVSTEEITDSDNNISTMFQTLRKKKRVKLEILVLNKKSFPQSIDNLFALSFLVKDGRVVIDMDENGSHFLSPRNGPAARLVKSGEVKYNHFVFRLDFADWELMKKCSRRRRRADAKQGYNGESSPY